MIGCWSYTVILTYVGLASAVCGISFSILFALGEISSLWIPMVCLLFSGFCDLFDGRIARSKKNRTEREKQFGIQIDSLCDLVCFGVQPAVFGFCVGSNRILGVISMICLILGGVVRLAYFNVIEMERRADPDNHDMSYTGLPITSTSLIAPFLFCFRTLLGAGFGTVYQAAMILVAFLFISKIHIKKPGTKGVIAMVSVGTLILVACIILTKI